MKLNERNTADLVDSVFANRFTSVVILSIWLVAAYRFSIY